MAPGAQPQWPGAGPTARPDGARWAGRPGTALRALAPRELPWVLRGQPGAQLAPGGQGLGLQGPPAPCPTDPWGLSDHSGPHMALTVTHTSTLGLKCSAVTTGWVGSCPPGLPSRGLRPALPLADPCPWPAPSRGGLGGAHRCRGASCIAAGRAEPHGNPVQAPCPPCALGSSWRGDGGSPMRGRGQRIHSGNPANSPVSSS